MITLKEIKNRFKVSKYRLSKDLGISWNAISAWDKGWYKPNAVNQAKLDAYVKSKECENNHKSDTNYTN